MSYDFYTDSQIVDIVLLRRTRLSWGEVAEHFNKKYNTSKSSETLRAAYKKYGDQIELTDDQSHIKTLKSIITTKKQSSHLAKQNKVILETLVNQDDLLERVSEIVGTINKGAVKISKFSKAKIDKRKKAMTIEVLLSDLHYGKKTDTFNLEVARRRMKELASTVIKEIYRSKELYNVERLIVALLGDIIESYTMHKLESARGCEFGNSRQIQEAINSLFFDFFVPVSEECAKLGVKIDVPSVTGNHDRTENDRTMADPGEENVTYIIYKTLELLIKQSKMNHVQFYIPKSPYQTLDIYGSTALYEHGDNSKANTRQALLSLMASRQGQLGKIISFMRVGHYHEATIFGRGKIIVNGCLPGQDSYADVKGYDTDAEQLISYYVQTSDRPTPYYRSFPVYLE